MQTVLITGGTGMVGKKLTPHLIDKGYRVIILTRSVLAKPSSSPLVTYALWDVKASTMDLAALKSADHIVHLAGAGVVDKKWTPAYKKEIKDSRTESSRVLMAHLKDHHNKIKTVVSASAIGWYGADAIESAKTFVETDAAAPGFLGDTCKLWEQSVAPTIELQKRLVKLRLGIVLSNDGGALAEFKKPLKLGVAGILGSGKQIISWIHIDDLCRMFISAIENEQLTGAYNAVAPNPVTNKKLTIELAKASNGKYFIPLHVPEFVLKIMLGDRSIEVLKSATVSSKKMEQTGFPFLYPTIEQALQQLCQRGAQ